MGGRCGKTIARFECRGSVGAEGGEEERQVYRRGPARRGDEGPRGGAHAPRHGHVQSLTCIWEESDGSPRRHSCAGGVGCRGGGGVGGDFRGGNTCQETRQGKPSDRCCLPTETRVRVWQEAPSTTTLSYMARQLLWSTLGLFCDATSQGLAFSVRDGGGSSVVSRRECAAGT